MLSNARDRGPMFSVGARRSRAFGMCAKTMTGFAGERTDRRHGTSISGQDDRNERGICLEPPEYVTVIARVPAGVDAGTASVEFEQ